MIGRTRVLSAGWTRRRAVVLLTGAVLLGCVATAPETTTAAAAYATPATPTTGPRRYPHPNCPRVLTSLTRQGNGSSGASDRLALQSLAAGDPAYGRSIGHDGSRATWGAVTVVRVSDSRLAMRVPPVLGLVRLSTAGAYALVAPVIEAVRRRQWTRLWLGPSAATVVAGLALAFRTRTGHALLLTYAITRPGDAPQAILVKLPLSMFAPAARLPFWFALFQVGMVFSISQTLVGVRRTLLVAFGAHALATAADPLWVWLGPPVGVPPRYRSFGDAGPSVAVVALLAYLAVWCGVLWLAAAIACYDATELVIFDGLSQRGHLAGTIIGIVSAAVATRVVHSRDPAADTEGTAGRGQPSGQPSAPV